jgi:MFS transporter, DHA3 family, macrolide efflux protein
MRIFVPLRHRPLAKLWAGQLLSSVGDEVNRVAAVWLAAGLWGNRAGWLMAIHSGTAFFLSLAAGRIVDRWAPRRTMLGADLLRALAVLLVPLGYLLHWPMSVLLAVSVAVCGGLGVFFDPALRGLIPTLVPSPNLRGATNALMESTTRFARVLGPGLIALVGAYVPMVHFFTLDGLTFLLSACTVLWLAKDLPAHARHSVQNSAPLEPWWRLLRQQGVASYAVWSGMVVNAAWTLVMPLGMGLVVHERMPENVSMLGTVIAAYGVGNIASNLLVGNFAEARPERLLFMGRTIAGLGFLCFAAASTPWALMASAAFAASGGPVADVGILGLFQTRFRTNEVASIYRGYITLTYGAIFALFFFSPVLFETFGVQRIIACAALVILSAGAFGLYRYAFGEPLPSASPLNGP